ncbi:unnamed protein product [Triticum turgidum subsp. durum]|uniref:peroxidase n=1 Tax=Triticum turgidum subsp. durum TaxID=4567 RepID=A0A9R1P9K5_TRITD|nr:unnamed protein product [Triticum turgidum subsp. durum]
MASRAAAAIAVLALVCAAVHSSEGQLSPNFHAATCPDLEHIVEFHVAETFRRDVGVAPALIRILFHDCFPQGCDAAPFFDVPTLISSFSNRSLDVADLVSLSGAHTFGVAHCPAFEDRFKPVFDTNPAIDSKFATSLRNKCAGDNPAGTLTQNLDVRTPDAFDNKYYFDLIARQGLFKSDQGLIDHPTTKRMATRFSLNQGAFFEQFARSMTKMSNMDLLTGNKGEIRNNCAAPNRRVQDIETATTGDEGIAADM